LKHWGLPKVASRIQGKWGFHGQLKEDSPKTWSLQGKFDEAQVAFDLPHYGKQYFEKPIPLSVTGIGTSTVKVSSDISALFWADVRLKENKQGEYQPFGHIGVYAPKADKWEDNEPGVMIWTTLSEVTPDMIDDTVDMFNNDKPGRAHLPWLNGIALHANQFTYLGQKLTGLESLIEFDHGVNISFSSPEASGDIAQDSNSSAWFVNMQHLNWMPAPEGKESNIAHVKPADIPALNLSIDYFSYNNNPLGALTALTQQAKGAYMIEEARLKNEDMEVLMTGDWTLSKKGSLLGLSMQVKAHDWYEQLKKMGFKHAIIDAESGQADLVLTWPGAPYDFDVKKLQGGWNFHFINGAVMNANPSVARFLGMFSLESINRRILSELDDVHGQDLIFDAFQGSYAISSGVLKTHDAHLTGPVLDLTFIGEVDIPNRALDKRVRVVPHLGDSMAIVAGVIGGPVAAAVTWVTDKVLGKTVFKNGAVMYHLVGDWDNYTIKPVVE